MDIHGVDWTVLVQTSWSTWDNGYIADSVERFPNRFIGHGLIDPQNPNNAEQVRYWIQERGLVGFRFHPMYYPDEKILLTHQSRTLFLGILIDWEHTVMTTIATCWGRWLIVIQENRDIHCSSYTALDVARLIGHR